MSFEWRREIDAGRLVDSTNIIEYRYFFSRHAVDT